MATEKSNESVTDVQPESRWQMLLTFMYESAKDFISLIALLFLARFIYEQLVQQYGVNWMEKVFNDPETIETLKKLFEVPR
jgi:hypothetical protein